MAEYIATRYLQEGILKHFFKISALQTSTPYLALGLSEPDRDNASSWPGEFTNSIAPGYKRAKVSFSVPETPNETGSIIRNDDWIEFPVALLDWPSASWLSLWDSESGGHMLVILPFQAPAVPEGDSLTFDTNTMHIIIHGNPPPYGPREGIMNHVFRGMNYPQPSSLYMQLYVEATGLPPIGGYTPKPVESWELSPTQPAIASRARNTAGTAFGPATTNWGRVRCDGLYDLDSGGQMVYAVYVGGGITINAGDRGIVSPLAMTTDFDAESP